MKKTLLSSWALFLGISFIMLGHGLQSTLLGVRAVEEDFATIATGIVMSGYYIGMLMGSIIAPQIIKNVGHVRVFGAAASTASIAILLHPLAINPIIWLFLRIITGICLASIYVTAESWLNDKATNKNRGKLFSIYMVVLFGGGSLGAFLLNVWPVTTIQPFVLVSILLSLSMVPILITIGSAPDFSIPKKVGLRRIYKNSPLAVISSIGVGCVHGAIFMTGAIYTKTIGLSTLEISVFVFIIYFAGSAAQWPMGWVSDRMDRRKLIIISTFVAGLIATTIPMAYEISLLLFFFTVALFSISCLPLYSVTVAHANDFLKKDEMVAASGTLVLLNGAGCMMGPILVSVMMWFFGSHSYFYTIAVLHVSVGLFALYRTTVRPAPDPSKTKSHVVIPRRPVGTELITEAIAKAGKK